MPGLPWAVKNTREPISHNQSRHMELSRHRYRRLIDGRMAARLFLRCMLSLVTSGDEAWNYSVIRNEQNEHKT